MAKFGLFVGDIEQPLRTYEGDRMIWDTGKEYVQITTGNAASGISRTVAVIRLDKGQSLKEIK